MGPRFESVKAHQSLWSVCEALHREALKIKAYLLRKTVRREKFSWSFLCLLSFSKESKLVLIAARVHPFPSRTRKLSSPAPKILAWRRAGKIGNANTKSRQYALSAFCCAWPPGQKNLFSNEKSAWQTRGVRGKLNEFASEDVNELEKEQNQVVWS